MHKKNQPTTSSKTTVTVQIEQLTEQSHVKHVEAFTAKTSQHKHAYEHKNQCYNCIYFFFLLHQYLFL